MNKLDDNFFTNNSFFDRIKSDELAKKHRLKAKEFDNRAQMKRLRTPIKLKPFGDADKDGIPNIVDRRPFKKDKTNKIWRILQ